MTLKEFSQLFLSTVLPQFDKNKICDINIQARAYYKNYIQGGKLMKSLELTSAQVSTLIGILKTEEVTLKDIIEEEDNSKDLKSLKSELKNVQNILSKLID